MALCIGEKYYTYFEKGHFRLKKGGGGEGGGVVIRTQRQRLPHNTRLSYICL